MWYSKERLKARGAWYLVSLTKWTPKPNLGGIAKNKIT